MPIRTIPSLFTPPYSTEPCGQLHGYIHLEELLGGCLAPVLQQHFYNCNNKETIQTQENC